MKRKVIISSETKQTIRRINHTISSERKSNYDFINTIINSLSLIATILGFYFIYTSLKYQREATDIQIRATNAQIESLNEQRKATTDQIRATKNQIKSTDIQTNSLIDQKKSTIAQTVAIGEQIKSNEAQNTSNQLQFEQLKLIIEQDRRSLQPIFKVKDLNSANLKPEDRIQALQLTLVNNKAVNVLMKPIKNDVIEFYMSSSMGDTEEGDKIDLTYKNKNKIFNYLRNKSGYYVIQQDVLDIIFMDLGDRIYKQTVFTNGVYFSISRAQLYSKGENEYRQYMKENPIIK